MPLDYLDFDYTEDADGNGTFDALASTGAAQVAAVHSEIAAVLRWAHAAFAGGRGPLDEGGEWDFDLQAQREFSVTDTLVFDEGSGTLRLSDPGTGGAPGAARHTVSLSISGSAAFCDAFRTRFDID